jgi:hypothetical protein
VWIATNLERRRKQEEKKKGGRKHSDNVNGDSSNNSNNNAGLLFEVVKCDQLLGERMMLGGGRENWSAPG